jgi:hypothetical protein
MTMFKNSRYKEISRFQRIQISRVIIIIHLLGLAPAGYLASSDNGP